MATGIKWTCLRWFLAGAFVSMRWIEFPAITTGTSSDCREITSINAAKCSLLANKDKAQSRQLTIVPKKWLRLSPFPILQATEEFRLKDCELSLNVMLYHRVSSFSYFCYSIIVNTTDNKLAIQFPSSSWFLTKL